MRFVSWAFAGVAALTLSITTPSSAVMPYIVGGSPTSISQVPWQVSISASGNLCGGSLINVDWVVTAAHCVSGVEPTSMTVYSGIDQLSQRSSANRSSVSNIHIHPNWNGTTFLADIALLELSAPVALSNKVQIISLPSNVDPAAWPAQGIPAVVSGWGATSVTGLVSEQLNSANISILAGPGTDTCGDYGSDYQSSDDICAGTPTGGIDTCSGDSGGPLVVTEAGIPLLAGVTSVGNECALPNFPGIYTRVTSYLSWIREFVPDSAGVPSTPTNVTAVTRANGKVLVKWQPVANIGSDPVVSYTVSTLAADSSLSEVCVTSAPQCLIAFEQIGQKVNLVVQAKNSGEFSAASPAISIVPVHSSSAEGKLVSTNRVALFAGLTRVQAKNVTLKVRTASRSKCFVTSRGVRMKAPGLCVVGVQSNDRKSVRGTTYIQIR